MRNLQKKVCKVHAWWGGRRGRGGAWGKNCEAISAAVPLTISFSVSEAITGQQSTTAPQLSCLWFLIKTKRRDPSKTLFAFQATQVIIFIMDTIIMCEKWSHYYSPFSNKKGLAETGKISSFCFLPVCHPNIVTIRTIIVIKTWIIQRCAAVSAVASRHNQYAGWRLHHGKVHHKF